MPISAFIFGGRRSTAVPLVSQAFNWAFGVYTAATIGSETTAAAFGKLGQVRRDPFAMLPFCGYHMGDYFRPLARVRPQARRTRRGSSTSTGSAATKTASSSGPASATTSASSSGSSTVRTAARARPRGPLGWAPKYEDLDWRGLNFSEAQFEAARTSDRDEWFQEIASHNELFFKLYDRLPRELPSIRDLLLSTLWRMPKKKAAAKQ